MTLLQAKIYGRTKKDDPHQLQLPIHWTQKPSAVQRMLPKCAVDYFCHLVRPGASPSLCDTSTLNFFYNFYLNTVSTENFFLA